jgi:cell division protein FtsI (penicillin-binding protein 3)
VAQVIQKSSNIGSAKLALSMKPERCGPCSTGVGFGTPLKLGFPGEVGGRLRPAKTWRRSSRPPWPMATAFR